VLEKQKYYEKYRTHIAVGSKERKEGRVFVTIDKRYFSR